jgi:hypothetical protein
MLCAEVGTKARQNPKWYSCGQCRIAGEQTKIRLFCVAGVVCFSLLLMECGFFVVVDESWIDIISM